MFYELAHTIENEKETSWVYLLLLLFASRSMSHMTCLAQYLIITLLEQYKDSNVTEPEQLKEIVIVLLVVHPTQSLSTSMSS